MRITASSLSEFGLIDEVLPEPLGGAHRDPEATAEVIRNALLKHLTDVDQLDMRTAAGAATARLAGFGQFKEA